MFQGYREETVSCGIETHHETASEASSLGGSDAVDSII